MEQRIQMFENLWRNRLLPPPVLQRFHDDYPEPCPLVRCDNRHHLLPADKFAIWWTATSEEKDAIMAEYDALNYDDEEEVYDMLLIE